MSMRLFILICSGMLLGACATTPANTAPTQAEPGLPTSKLKPGECGLFGWTTGQQRDFVFYADEKAARYDSLNGPIDLTAQSPFPAENYLDEAGNPVMLRLGTGEAMSGGMRYPTARIVTLTDEGWERVQPVAIIKTCQPQ